jgi:hypothetical protein
MCMLGCEGVLCLPNPQAGGQTTADYFQMFIQHIRTYIPMFLGRLFHPLREEARGSRLDYLPWISEPSYDSPPFCE